MPRRSPAHVEARRAQVARLYLKGQSLREIAVRFDVSHVSVFNDLEAIRASWKATRETALDQWTAEQLAKLDAVEAAAWEGWDASRRDTVTKLDETTGEPPMLIGAGPVIVFGGELKTKTSERRQSNAGDPTFLAVVERCIERRCKLLGIDAPSALTISGQVTVREYPAQWGALLAPATGSQN